MKSIILSYFLTGICLVGFAQVKRVGVTAQISNPIRDTQVGWFDIDVESFDNYNVRDNSFAIGLLGVYRIKESIVRLRFNYTKVDIEEYHDVYLSGARDYTSVRGKQNKITIAPGVMWKAVNKDKLDLYVGFELPLTIHGEFEMNSQAIVTDSISGTLISDSFTDAQIPRGYSIGIGGLGGFNYFLRPRLSLGAEYSPSLLYAKLGGRTISTARSTAPSPGSGTGTSEDALEGFTFFEHRFSVGLSIWF